jgi:hypothetical protein
VTWLADRLVRLEREGVDTRGLLNDVVRVLGLDAIEIRRLVGEDERERLEKFQRWLDEPVMPVLYERVIPGVVLRVWIPDAYAQASRDVLEAYAADFARRARHKVCLQLTNRYSTWFEEDGTVGARSDATLGEIITPFMTLA